MSGHTPNYSALVVAAKRETKTEARVRAMDAYEIVQELHALEDAAEKLEETSADLLEALKGLLEIVSESRGVTGFHLNGDVAPWSEFAEDTEAADAAISRATGGDQILKDAEAAISKAGDQS